MLPAFLIGLAAGHRSATPLAVLGWHHRHERPLVAAAAGLAGAGELVADKLPATPARMEKVPLVARLGAGAVAGGLVGRTRVTGALAGATGAAIGAFAGYKLRTGLARRVGRDWPVAVAEDALAIGLSTYAIRTAENA